MKKYIEYEKIEVSFRLQRIKTTKIMKQLNIKQHPTDRHSTNDFVNPTLLVAYNRKCATLKDPPHIMHITFLRHLHTRRK